MNLIDRLDNFATDSFQYIDDEFLVVLNEFQVRYIQLIGLYFALLTFAHLSNTK